MLLGLAQSFPPDDFELRLPEVADARALLARENARLLDRLEVRRARMLDAFGPGFGDAYARGEDAIVLALGRMGLRHGSFGDDFHPYHNEEHAMEILDRRVQTLIDCIGIEALPGADWLALMLFGACHDLRQREVVDFRHPIGNNEAASIAEAHRTLDAAGFDPARDHAQYLALELMIAGSTFDARPAPPPSKYNPAEVATSGGALAAKLPAILDRERPDWRHYPEIDRALRLTMIASDLDTANVAEPFPQLAGSAVRLCREREKLSGRPLDAAESGKPCLDFLSRGQERYFFELHRFHSAEGARCFAPSKEANAPRVHAVSAALRERFAGAGEDRSTGAEVIDAFLELARQLAAA